MSLILGLVTVLGILFTQGVASVSVRNVLPNATVTYNNCVLHDLKDLRNQTFDPSELIITHCYLPELPNAFFIRLKNITSLEISDSKMTTIDDFAFNGMPGLRSLNLARNNISIIKSWSLEDMKNLTSLDLRRNQIRTIAGNHFSRCSNLQKLNLASNLITDLQPNVFSYVLNLRYLNLGRNAIRTIGQYAFRGLTKVTHLDLNHNQIETIEKGAFDSIASLRSLRLEGNRLTEIGSSLVEKLPHLGHLNLSHNLLGELTDGIFDRSTELKSLDLSFNRFVNVSSKMLSGLEALEMLNFSSNQLENIDPEAFSDLHNITIFDLSVNSLSSLASGVFEYFHKMIYMNLSKNGLVDFEDSIFHEMNALTILDLSENHFYSEDLLLGLPADLKLLDISRNLYRSLNLSIVNAERVNLAGNPWECQWLVVEMIRAPDRFLFGNNYSVESSGEILNVMGIDCFDDLTKRSIILMKQRHCDGGISEIPENQRAHRRHHFVNFRLTRDTFDQKSVLLWLFMAVGIVFMIVKGGRAVLKKSEVKSEQLRQMNQERMLQGLREYHDNSPAPKGHEKPPSSKDEQ